MVQRRSSVRDIEKGDADLEDECLNTQPGFRVQKISLDLLEIGDMVRVPNGSMPPADGTIVRGEESAFDESSLTGESKPVRKNVGDAMFMGTINKANPVDVEVIEELLKG
jgi:P-type E1-E2 ATPase